MTNANESSEACHCSSAFPLKKSNLAMYCIDHVVILNALV